MKTSAQYALAPRIPQWYARLTLRSRGSGNRRHSLWLYLRGFGDFIAGRYQDALDHLQESIRLNPSIPGPYRLRAACLSQLGRVEEARTALKEFLRLVPTATITSMTVQVPLKRAEDFERYADALRRGGLPE